MPSIRNEQTVEHIREQNRIRAAKFYAAHKTKILSGRVDDRKELKECRNKNTTHTPAPVQQPEPVQTPEPVPTPEPDQQPETATTIKQKKSKIIYSEKYVINFLENFDFVADNKSNSNRAIYLSQARNIFRITECPNLLNCVKTYEATIKKLKNGKQMNGEPYSINSLKTTYSAILFLIDNIPLPVSKEIKKKYEDEFQGFKIKSTEQNNERQNDENYAVPPFKTLMKNVLDKFSEDSPQYIIVSMFNEVPCRDDFDLTVVKSNRNITDEETNYLIVPSSGKISIKIQSYKTAKKYDTINETYSPKVSNLIRKYLKDRNIEEGSKLFPTLKNGITDLVSKMMKKIGIQHGGINALRQSKINESLSLMKDITPEKRVELARQFKHSPVAQLKYVRKLT